MKVNKAQVYLNQLNQLSAMENKCSQFKQDVFSVYCQAIQFFGNCHAVSNQLLTKDQIQPEYYAQLRKLYQNYLATHQQFIDEKGKNDQVFSHLLKQNFCLMNKMNQPVTIKKCLQTSFQSLQDQQTFKKQKDEVQQNVKNLVQKKNQIKQNQNWLNIKKKYEQFQIDQAFRQLTAYKKIKKQFSLQEEILIQIVQSQYYQMIKYQNLFHIEQFNLDTKEDGKVTHYKFSQVEGEGAISFHTQGQFDIKLQNLMTILSQIKLYPKYVPLNQRAQQLKEVQNHRKIGVSRLGILFLDKCPFYFISSAYDRLKQNGSIYFCARKISSKEAKTKFGCKNISEEIEKLQIDFKHVILQYRPISKTRANIKMFFSLQINLPIAPRFLVKKTARTFAFTYFQNITNLNKNFQKSEWFELQKKYPQIYQLFKQKVNKHLDNKS